MICRCRSSSPAPAPALEDEDLLLEILLRLSPQLSSLSGAGAASSPTANSSATSVLTTANPPLLGFFIRYLNGHSFTPNRIPAARFSLPQSRDEHRDFLGCRHGLTLLLNRTRLEAVVWDPITGHQRCVAFPPGFDTNQKGEIRPKRRGAQRFR